ncbi:hypothetical protein BN946_scf184962.g67 [Trametes cinnabarina]|uniref:Uncharacterized protein n=1 Tax=Pycnoporus cinnabarinus TaxID=5643 RepID=A0A060SIQ9_PYCCI|nr:hypothetical protein BN946_scf184962.g67 [Trametes cinnabarina]
MAAYKPLAHKRSVWQKPTRPGRSARGLVLAAKLRARRPITIPQNFRIWPERTASTDVHVQTIAPLRPTPFPPYPEKPLIEPAFWRHLPAKLARPEMPDVKPENVALAQPGYEGLSPKHVRSGWSHTGYKWVPFDCTPLSLSHITLRDLRVLGMYRKLYVDPPKTGLREAYNLLVTDSGLANCATHIFGLKVIADPRPGGRRAHVLRLPMVPIAIPYPHMFFPVMRFVYTYRKSDFINLLLPCADFVLPPDSPLDPPKEVTIPRYAQALAESFDLRKLCQYAKNVHGAYRNMVALGVVEDRMWDALDYAWETILAAMDVSEKAAEAGSSGDAA